MSRQLLNFYLARYRRGSSIFNPRNYKVFNGYTESLENIFKISELYKGAKHLQYSSDFMNKIEETYNTAFFQPNRFTGWSPAKPFFINLLLFSYFFIIYATI